MSGEGVGKIKPKRSHSAKKPYERSTSFLGKIKDSVKDLLIPSWLVGSSDNVNESESESASSTKTQGEKQNGPGFYSGVQSHGFRQSTCETDTFPHFNEMPRQQTQFSGASSMGQGRNALVGEPYMSDFGPAPNVNIAALEQQNVSWHANKESPIFKLASVFQQEPKRRKTEDSARLRMSDSYINEVTDQESDDAPSGQLMMSTSVMRKPAAKQVTSTPQLWSPESAKIRKALSHPVKDKPAFNSFLFASSSKPSSDSFGNSSFYTGKTCYGGSAARRKKALNTSLPYQSSLPLRKQVTANKLNSSLNATTSSTAQRILETLDRMSTPLGDAKKIPQDTNDSVISFTPSSYRRASSIGSRSVTRPLQLPERGPPTAQHQTLSQAVLARNRNRVSGVDRRRQDSNKSELMVSQEISAVREVVQPSVPSEPLSSQSLPSSGTGKLKSKKFSQHISNRKEDDGDDEVVIVPDLSTNFTLPIKNINPISLSSTQPKFASLSASSIPSRESSALPLQFTFSTPIEKRRPSASNQSLNNSDQGFKFSTPIKASQSKLNAMGAEGGSKLSPEPAVGASSVVPPSISFSGSTPVWSTAAKPKAKAASPDIGGTSSSFKSYNKWSGYNDSSAASDLASSPGGFSIVPASTLKSGSVMDILGGKSSSPAAAAATQNDGPADDPTPKFNSAPETDDLMAKFRKPAGSWECDACMLSNKPEAVKCIACETPKPGAENSAPPTVSQPFSMPKEPDDLMAKFKKPAGSWECDICMVQNTSTASRCIACDSPNPDLDAAGTASKKPESSAAAAAVQFVPGGGFVLNASATSATSTGSGGFKFGNTATTSSSAVASDRPAATGFVFGQTSSATTSTAAPLSGGFKFGSSPAKTIPSTASGGGGSAETTAPSLTSRISFGSSATSSNSAAVPFGGAPSTAASDSAKSDSVSSVVEVSVLDKLNSNTNGSVSFPLDNNNKSSPFVFGSASALPVSSSATSLTAINPLPAQSPSTASPSQPPVNFNFGAPSSVPSLSSGIGQKTTQAKPLASGLFQFGATPNSTPVNNTGLGTGPSLAAPGKPVVNGSSALAVPNHSATSSGFGNTSSVAVFGGFGQNSFSGPAAASAPALPSHTVKRTIGFEESEPSSAKKSFNFGSIDNQTTLNGGFHFGGAGQTAAPVFGSAAGASAPAAAGGFVFGSNNNTKPLAAQPSGPALGGGFNFGGSAPSVNNTGGFNFGQAAAAAKPEQAKGLAANFNFGGAGQSSAAPFQFGAKPVENAAAPAPFVAPNMIVPNLGGGPMGMGAAGAFTMGTGGTDTSQRKVRKAVRRIRK